MEEKFYFISNYEYICIFIAFQKSSTPDME